MVSSAAAKQCPRKAQGPRAGYSAGRWRVVTGIVPYWGAGKTYIGSTKKHNRGEAQLYLPGRKHRQKLPEAECNSPLLCRAALQKAS